MSYYINHKGRVCETKASDIVKNGFVDVMFDTGEIKGTFVVYESLEELMRAVGGLFAFI